VVLLALLAWMYLLYLQRQMADVVTDAEAMRSMGMPVDQPWNAADLWFGFVMWAVMMAAMMAPSATPMLLVVARSSAARGESGSAMTLAFGAGYFAAWLGFSLVAALAQWGLHDAALLSPFMAAASVRTGGAILIVAGLYQLTPLKRACLIHCRSPLDFLMAHWRGGTGGAFRMGLHHGMYCLGCCWALMLVLFAVGIMNLVWVAAIGVFVLIEKTWRGGLAISRAAAGVLILIGAVWILRG
jgi:predicted metal-binding membrane protein